MSAINLGAGGNAPSSSSAWTLRDRLRNLTTALSGDASLDMRFDRRYFYKKDIGQDAEQYPAFELFDAVCSRGSSGWYPEWDFTNGGVCGRLTEYGPNALRYGSQGLLKEASRTNQIRNPRGEDNAQNWGPFSGSLSYAGSGYEDGWPYVDVACVSISGTAQILFEAEGVVPAAPGSVWTLSAGARLLSGSDANTKINLSVVQRSSTLAQLGQSEQDNPVGVGVRHRRLTLTTSAGPEGLASVTPRILLRPQGGAPDTFTLRIYAPQLELGSAPSSPILPPIGTPAASTRTTETVTSLTTVSRASRKSNAGEWDFTNGGAVGAYREFLPNVPAVTGKGLLVEEGTTNQIRNPRGEGASGSTAPTGWVFSAAGATATYQRGVENGWEYVDVTVTGTPSGDMRLDLTALTDVAALQGQTWTASVGLRLVAGTLNAALKLALFERTSSLATVVSDLSPSLAVGGTHRRFALTRTLTGATTAYVPPSLYFDDPAGAANFTLRIYAPQLEQKAYPTSPVLPPKGSPAASTRAADNIEVGNGGWASNNALTLFADLAATNVASTAVYAVAASANLSNFVSFGQTGGGKHWARLVEGAATTQNNQADVVVGQPILLAAAAKSGDSALSVTGSTQTTSTVAIDVSDYDKLTLGSIRSVLHANCYIRQIRYFPVRKTNAELEALVGNS